MREVRPGHIQDTLIALTSRTMKHGRGKGKPMAASTLVSVRARLRTVFRAAVSDRVIFVSPAEGIKRVRAAHTPPERVGQVLDFHEAARLRELGDALERAGLCRLWPALFTAISLGLRRGEIMGLRWEDVNLGQGVFRVRQTRTTAGGEVLTAEPKTKNSVRDLPIPASLAAILKRHRDHQRLEREKADFHWRETGAVFATEVSSWTRSEILNRALAALLRWSDPAQWEKRWRAANWAHAMTSRHWG